MALCVSSKAIIGVNVGRPSVRCAAVPLAHVHFTPPATTPLRDSAIEVMSILTKSNVTKPFLVVQAPSDLLMNTDSMYLLAFEDKSDTDILDVQDAIRNWWARLNQDTNDQLDQQKSADDRIDDLKQK